MHRSAIATSIVHPAAGPDSLDVQSTPPTAVAYRDILMQGTLALTTVEQLQALAHPLRQRVLRLLAGEPRTNKQLASRLDTSPGKLHFHVRELEKAGLIALVEERPKGGIIEKYYQATAQNFTLELPIGKQAMIDGFTTATLEAASQEYARAVAHFRKQPSVTSLHHAEARLSEAQVTRIKALLDTIAAEMNDSDDEALCPEDHAYIFTSLFHTMADSQTDPETQIP